MHNYAISMRRVIGNTSIIDIVDRSFTPSAPYIVDIGSVF